MNIFPFRLKMKFGHLFLLVYFGCWTWCQNSSPMPPHSTKAIPPKLRPMVPYRPPPCPKGNPILPTPLHMVTYKKDKRKLNSINLSIRLINNFMEQLQVHHSMALITTTADMDIMQRYSLLETKIFTSTFLSYDDLNETRIKEYKQIHLKDNIPNLYMILQPIEKLQVHLNYLLKLIRLADYTSKIVILHEVHTDISIYEWLPIYGSHCCVYSVYGPDPYQRLYDIYDWKTLRMYVVVKCYKNYCGGHFSPAPCSTNEFRNKYNFTRIYDTYFLNPISENRSTYNFYEINYLGTSRKGELRQINKWSEGIGFDDDIDLPLSFKGSFYNTSLVIGIVEDYPNVIRSRESKRWWKYKVDGVVYRNYMDLGEMLNLKWEFKFPMPTKPIIAGTLANIHTGFEWEYDLKSGWIDVGGGAIMTYNELISPYFDVSASTHYHSALVINSIEPSKSLRWFSLFAPFPWYTWIIISILIPSVGIALYIVRHCAPSDNPVEHRVSLPNCMWEVVVIICWDSVKIHNPTWPVFILLSCYMPMAMMIVIMYMDGYTAAVTAPKYSTPPINTFTQLEESGVTILSPTEKYTEFIKSENSKLSSFDNKRFTTIPINTTSYRHDDYMPASIMFGSGETFTFEDPWIKVCIKMQTYPDNYVFIGIPKMCKNYIDRFSHPRYRRFYESKERLSNKYGTLYYPKTFLFKEHFNRKIMRQHAMGMIKMNGTGKVLVQHSGGCHIYHIPQYDRWFPAVFHRIPSGCLCPHHYHYEGERPYIRHQRNACCNIRRNTPWSN